MFTNVNSLRLNMSSSAHEVIKRFRKSGGISVRRGHHWLLDTSDLQTRLLAPAVSCCLLLYLLLNHSTFSTSFRYDFILFLLNTPWLLLNHLQKWFSKVFTNQCHLEQPVPLPVCRPPLLWLNCQREAAPLPALSQHTENIFHLGKWSINTRLIHADKSITLQEGHWLNI